LTSDVRVTRLDNGVRVISESVRDVASMALGVWVENGSRYETERLRGVSHFIEHLLFKGTPTRSARRIAEEIESLGGSIDAFTGKEYTCYHTRTLGAHLDVAMDVLSDIFLHALLRSDDVEVERQVIIQEILESEDLPDDYVHDYHLESYWPGHPLGWPVAGTVESVSALSRADIATFMADRYRPDRVLIVAAGAVDHDTLVENCRRRFDAMEGSYRHAVADKPDFCPGVFVCPRDIEQVHLVLGMPGLAMMDPRRYSAEVLITALGGGMSSRLFQEVREERGLAYSIYAFQSPFRDIGYTGVYAATRKDAVGDVVELITGCLARIAENGLEPGELADAKGQLIGSIPLSLESTDARMFRIARNHIYAEREIPVSEVIDQLRATTESDVLEVAREIFDFDRLGVALLGDADARLLSLPSIP